MAGARRLQRHGGVKVESPTYEDTISPVLNMQAPLPQHCKLPDVPVLNDVVFHLGYLANSLVLMAFQYINLYNAINWLPHSSHEYSVDFSAIDTDLVVLIVLILSYRLLKSVLLGGSLIAKVIQWLMLCVYYLAIAGTFVLITYKYPAQTCMSLLVPPLLYLLLFGTNVVRYLAKYVPYWPASIPTDPYEMLVPPSTERTSRSVFHACSMNPENIRREVFLLKTDFNFRLKTAFYDAVLHVYYATVVPVIFCKETAHLDMKWSVAYVLLTALSLILISYIQRIPASYMDTLHKSAVHLGRWRKHEERQMNIPHSNWSELTVWPKGVNVRHVKGLFKAEGINNTAEPGNPRHVKFYNMFSHPEYICALVALGCTVCTVLQFVMLLRYTHWYQVLATCGLLLSNYYALFLSCRDFLILYQVYKEEKFRYD